MTAFASMTPAATTTAAAAAAAVGSPAWLSTLLKKCSTMDQIKQLHAYLVTHALSHSPPHLANLLISLAVSALSHLPTASLLFDRIPNPSTFMWNTMIRGFSAAPDPENSVRFFARMLRSGGLPDRHTYPLLLKARLGRPDQFHGQIVRFGLDSDRFVGNGLVSAYANGGRIEDAFKVFDEMPVWDCVGWTALLDGLVKSGRGEEGLGVFGRMRGLGVELDGVGLVSVLCAVGMVGDLWFGRCLHGSYVVKGRVVGDVYVGSALVDMYGKSGCCEDAQRVFEEMRGRNVVAWSALIAGYVICSRCIDALLVFQRMLLEEVMPNRATLTSVLTACTQIGALDQGRWIHAFIGKKKIQMNVPLGTSLINMYAKCGSVEEALDVFMALSGKDVYPWTAMINGLAVHGHVDLALDFFRDMISAGVRPNAVTFMGVLSACSHGGLVDQGIMYFNSMSKVHGVDPTLDHYGCVVDLLGRNGRLQEALILIRNMSQDPGPGVWGALLAACVKHKDFELGELVGNHLIKSQPNHSGRYVLLANLYSTGQMWEEAASVRQLMKGTAVEKVLGFSWIEISGVIHEFIALDTSHSKSEDIYLMLNSLTTHIKGAVDQLIPVELHIT